MRVFLNRVFGMVNRKVAGNSAVSSRIGAGQRNWFENDNTCCICIENLLGFQDFDNRFDVLLADEQISYFVRWRNRAGGVIGSGVTELDCCSEYTGQRSTLFV